MKRLSRKPSLVKRAGSARLILLTLISFAFSVSLTRTFLNLTGFPQLGGGTIHIAHILWGGLALYAAALLPLLYANRKILIASASLTGLGIGLFIDEVGKYITADNDYFYPPAAPIIYGFFLLLVVLYSLIRQKPVRNDRTDMYHALDLMEEVLDDDLDEYEKKDIEETLEHVMRTSHRPEYRGLAAELLHFITAQEARKGLRDRTIPGWITSNIDVINQRVSTSFLAILLTISLVAMGAFMSIYPVQIAFATRDFSRLASILQSLIQQGLLTSSPEQIFLAVRLILEEVAGLLFILSGFILITKKYKVVGGRLAYFAFLLSFTVVDLLIFYYDQFSTIIFVTIQLIVFLMAQAYRQRIHHSIGV
jgi:hypothetical protein